MSQGRRKQAWEVMAKLVPSASYVDIENDDLQQEDNEIKKVEQFLNYLEELTQH